MKLVVLSRFYNRYLGVFLLMSLWINVVFSVLNKFFGFFFQSFFFFNISPFIKFIYLFLFIIILFFNYKKRKTLLCYLGLLSVVFVFANLGVKFDKNSLFLFFNSLKESNVFYFVKYIYPFVFIGVFSLAQNKSNLSCRYFELLEKLLIVNAFLVFLGVFFSIDYFQSYLNSNRFGCDGILERSFFVYFLIIIICRKILLKKIDVRFVILCLSGLLSGTKMMLLFFVLLLLFYLFQKGKSQFIYFISILLTIGLFFYKPIMNLAVKFFPFWQPLLNKSGYTTVLFSERNLTFQNTFQYLKSEGTLGFFLMGGLSFPKYWIEMDFIDLFLFFGFIGAGIYMFFLSKIVSKLYHFIPLVVCFFAGGFLLATTIMCTYFLWMYESHTEQKGLF